MSNPPPPLIRGHFSRRATHHCVGAHPRRNAARHGDLLPLPWTQQFLVAFWGKFWLNRCFLRRTPAAWGKRKKKKRKEKKREGLSRRGSLNTPPAKKLADWFIEWMFDVLIHASDLTDTGAAWERGAQVLRVFQEKKKSIDCILLCPPHNAA